MFKWLITPFDELSLLWLFVSAILGGIIGASSQFFSETFLPEQLKRKQRTKEVIAKYRDPLLKSGLDLQRRLYSIARLDFLTIYYQISKSEKEYAINHTLFVVAEFLCWVEILRREVQFVDFGKINKNKKLENFLEEVNKAFSTHETNATLRIFRGEQRAIGEIMIYDDETGMYCIGYAQFIQKLENDSQFAKWFSKLMDSIDLLATQSEKEENYERLVRIHDSLIDLLRFLDPNNVRIPNKRQKIL